MSSYRDFWRILYKIVKQGVSILVTTAYLDEAERCDRIGLLDQGKLLAAGTPAQIKELMTGQVLTIRSKDARKINRLLSQQFPELDVNVFGDTVHIVCQQIQETRKTAQRLIQDAGLRLDEITQALPTLEDVFVSSIAQSNDPHSCIFHLLERSWQSTHYTHRHVLCGTCSRFCSSWCDVHRSMSRQDHAMHTCAIARAQNCTKVAWVGHAINGD